MRNHFYLFLSVFHFTAGCDLVKNGQILEMTGYSGGSVDLPCSCTDLQTKPDQLTWRYSPYKHSYLDIYPTEQSQSHRNRVKVLNQISPGNLSLHISDLTTGDSGTYQCMVSSQHVYIQLTVKGCDLVKDGQTLEMTGYSGGSVDLPCSCTELQAKPDQLEWIYSPYKHSHYLDIYPTEQSHRNRVKVLNQISPGNLSLHISDLTTGDRGTYQCIVSSQHVFIKLTVKVKLHIYTTHSSKYQPTEQTERHTTTQQPEYKPTHPPSKPATSILILMAVLPVILLLALLAFIYWKCRGRKNVKKVTNAESEPISNQENQINLKPGSLTQEENVKQEANQDDVTYSAVVLVKTADKPACIQNNTAEYTEYASINIKSAQNKHS